MKQPLSRLFGPWSTARAPQLVDQVELRFIGDLVRETPLQVAVLNPDGSIAALSSIRGIADWLQLHGFHYATGSSGKWVRTAP